MNVTDEMIVQLDEFVQTMAEDQYRPNQKFVWEMLYGMIASGQVMLAEMARQRQREERLIHIEKRLSGQMKSERLDTEQLQQRCGMGCRPDRAEHGCGPGCR
jgi:hypothetical protein